MALEPEEKNDLEIADLFLALLRMPGWHAYLALLDKLIEERMNKVRHPVTLLPMTEGSAIDKMISLEADKGAIIGLRMARNAVDDMITHANTLRSRMTQSEADE